MSSSAIRSALEAGDIAAANRLLGYRWFVPAESATATSAAACSAIPRPICAWPRLPPPARHLRRPRRRRRQALDGVANFGRRPTFDNGAPLLEVHLFDFAGDLYGQTLDVEFIGWIRGEERFDSIEALIAQMDRDSVKAKRMLAEDKTVSMIG